MKWFWIIFLALMGICSELRVDELNKRITELENHNKNTPQTPQHQNPSPNPQTKP